MKKLVVLGMGLCVALAFSSCKSSESAYKKAYEKAKQQELAEAPADQVEATPVEAAPVVSAPEPLLKNMLVKRFGRIINIVSLSGIKGMPGQTNYSAAKGGMIAATKALAQEVARKHVTVNAVAPGFIRTDMTNGIDENEWKKQIPAGRIFLQTV